MRSFRLSGEDVDLGSWHQASERQKSKVAEVCVAARFRCKTTHFEPSGAIPTNITPTQRVEHQRRLAVGEIAAKSTQSLTAPQASEVFAENAVVISRDSDFKPEKIAVTTIET